MSEPNTKEYEQHSSKNAAYGNMGVYLAPIFISFILYNYLAAIRFNPYATLSIFVSMLIMGVEFSRTVIRRIEKQVEYKDVLNAFYYETGSHVYQEHIVLKEEARPIAFLDSNLQVMDKFPVTVEKLQQLETNTVEQAFPNQGVKFIEYEVTPDAQSQLFDKLLVAIPVSWNTLVVRMKDEFPYGWVLIEGKSIPLFLVKMKEWISKGNFRTVVCEVGFSAWHARMIQAKARVLSISDSQYVKRKRPMVVVNGKGETVLDEHGKPMVELVEQDVPIGSALLETYDSLHSNEKDAIIASRDSEIKAHEKQKLDFDKQSARFKDTLSDLDRRMRGGKKRGFGIGIGLPKSRRVRLGLAFFSVVLLIGYLLLAYGVIGVK